LEKRKKDEEYMRTKCDARGESIVGLWGQVQELHKRLLLAGVENGRLVLALDKEKALRIKRLRDSNYIDLTQED
jgi:plasmid rolling circle replication initiator protein Rep